MEKLILTTRTGDSYNVAFSSDLTKAECNDNELLEISHTPFCTQLFLVVYPKDRDLKSCPDCGYLVFTIGIEQKIYVPIKVAYWSDYGLEDERTFTISQL